MYREKRIMNTTESCTTKTLVIFLSCIFNLYRICVLWSIGVVVVWYVGKI